MHKKTFGKRYAKGIFKLACDENQIKEWEKSLKLMSELMQNPEMKQVLENPQVLFEIKKKILKHFLSEITVSALNLAYLLVKKKKVGIIALIEKKYTEIKDEYNKVKFVKMITAVPLKNEEQEKLIVKLEKIIGQKIKPEFKVDANILGGIILKIGDKLIDGSLKNRLAILKNSLYN